MIICQNCGKNNNPESHFCRFCGTRVVMPQPLPQQPQRQMQQAPPPAFDQSPPRPYSWKTDEFTTQNEARATSDHTSALGNAAGTIPFDGYRPQSLMHQAAGQMEQPFRCPNCMMQMMPMFERRISTAGWIVFAVLLVFFFPLFWIGLLIKEDVRVCPGCRSKLS